MTESAHTTNPSAERNTPREIVIDLEDACSSIRRHAAVLRCLTTDEGLEDVVRDALVQVANGLSDSHRDLRGKFEALFEQIVREGADKPQTITGAAANEPSTPRNVADVRIGDQALEDAIADARHTARLLTLGIIGLVETPARCGGQLCRRRQARPQRRLTPERFGAVVRSGAGDRHRSRRHGEGPRNAEGTVMTRELDILQIEIRLRHLKGLPGALDVMACADNLQKPEREALAALLYGLFHRHVEQVLQEQGPASPAMSLNLCDTVAI